MNNKVWTLVNGESFTVDTVMGANNGGGGLNLMVRTGGTFREVRATDVQSIVPAVTRPPLNGYRLVGVVPVTDRDGKIAEFYVVVERGEGVSGQYVTGWVRTLDAPEWAHGFYTNSYHEAMSNAAERAGWGRADDEY